MGIDLFQTAGKLQALDKKGTGSVPRQVRATGRSIFHVWNRTGARADGGPGAAESHRVRSADSWRNAPGWNDNAADSSGKVVISFPPFHICTFLLLQKANYQVRVAVGFVLSAAYLTSRGPAVNMRRIFYRLDTATDDMRNPHSRESNRCITVRSRSLFNLHYSRSHSAKGIMKTCKKRGTRDYSFWYSSLPSSFFASATLRTALLKSSWVIASR